MKEQNKKPEYDVITLLKIGKKEYLESFQKEGLMYMNTSKYFRDSEKALQSCQKDKYEGYSELFQPDKVTLEINGKEIKDVSGPIRISHGFDDNRNIFCLYAILYDRKKKEMLNVDPRNCEFGDHFLLIKDVDKFLKKVVIACKDKKLKYGFVEYIYARIHFKGVNPFKICSCPNCCAFHLYIGKG